MLRPSETKKTTFTHFCSTTRSIAHQILSPQLNEHCQCQRCEVRKLQNPCHTIFILMHLYPQKGWSSIRKLQHSSRRQEKVNRLGEERLMIRGQPQKASPSISIPFPTVPHPKDGQAIPRQQRCCHSPKEMMLSSPTLKTSKTIEP